MAQAAHGCHSWDTLAAQLPGVQTTETPSCRSRGLRAQEPGAVAIGLELLGVGKGLAIAAQLHLCPSLRCPYPSTKGDTEFTKPHLPRSTSASTEANLKGSGKKASG